MLLSDNPDTANLIYSRVTNGKNRRVRAEF